MFSLVIITTDHGFKKRRVKTETAIRVCL